MFKIGQKVRFTSEEMHKSYPAFYPPSGWQGVIEALGEETNQALVEWTSGSGTDANPNGGHAWWASYCNLEVVDND